MLGTCKFCPDKTDSRLVKVETNSKGLHFLEIEMNTDDDTVRTCVSDLNDHDDAFALEKHYHKNCYIKAERTMHVPKVKNSDEKDDM